MLALPGTHRTPIWGPRDPSGAHLGHPGEHFLVISRVSSLIKQVFHNDLASSTVGSPMERFSTRFFTNSAGVLRRWLTFSITMSPNARFSTRFFIHFQRKFAMILKAFQKLVCYLRRSWKQLQLLHYT